MRPVAVDAHAAVGDLVIGVAANMRAAIDDIDLEAGLGQFAGMHRSGKAGADHEDARRSSITRR